MYIVSWPRHITTNDCAPNCFGCKAASISFDSSCLENQGAVRREHKRVEVEMVRQMGAYKRLRKDGVQPVGINRAAEIEQFANSRFEVESGHRLSSAKVGKKYDETQQFFKEGGLVPLTAAGGE